MTKLQTRVNAALQTYAATGSKAAAIGSFAYPSSMSWSGASRSFASIPPRNTLWRSAEPLENSAVVNVLSWITRNFGQAEFGVCKENRKGEKEQIPNHPLQQLLERPNEWYGGQELWAGTLLSYHLDGNAYWIKLRNARGFGVPTAIWYEPHWSIKPHWPENGSAFIDYYERRVNGHIEKIDPANVIHFRNGLNPANPRYGLSPLRAALIQIYTDQEVDAWVAALCRNMAIPGVVVNPTTPVGMTEAKADQIKQTWKRKFGGDNRGEPLILDFEAAVSTIGFDPKNMEFQAIHAHAESRIAGALGVPAIVAGLTVGLESSTYNNLQNLKKSAWEECLIPAYENLEDVLDGHLLSDFEPDPIARGIYCEFDTAHVRALKEDQNQKEERILKRVQSGVMLVSEARSELGLMPDPNTEFYLLPNSATPTTPTLAITRANTQPPQTTNPTADREQQTGKGMRLFPVSHKSYQWEGLTLGREPSELEQLVIKGIDAAMSQGQQELTPVFLGMRNRWIGELAAEFERVTPDLWAEIRAEIVERDIENLLVTISRIFGRGAQLIIEELSKQGATLENTSVLAVIEDAFAQALVDTLAARASAETTVRATWSASQALMGGGSIRERILNDFADGSLAYVESLAAEGSNTAVAAGRQAESKAREADIAFWIYSAVLDESTCQPCGLVDGKTGQLEELPSVPNSECKGGARCRCILIAARKPE